jgi:acyl-CoA dehydrogenase
MATDGIVAETAARIFRDACDPGTVNRAADEGWKTPAWAALEEAGLPLAWVPELLGGAGAELADGFAVLREAGRGAVALPVAETLLSGWLLTGAGLAAPKGAMACGPAREGDRIVLGKGGTVSGRLRAIAFAREAGHLALVVEREGGGEAVALIEAGRAGIGDGASIAGDALNTVDLDGVRPVAVGEAPAATGRAALMLMGAAVRSVQMAGALEAILDLTVAYANERVAFGRPIGKFQAVQHNLARLAGEVAAAIAAAGSAADAIAGASIWGDTRATTSPPPLWGRDRVGGIAEQRGQTPRHQLLAEADTAEARGLTPSGVPPPLTPPRKGEGNPIGASFEEGVFLEAASAKIRVGEAAGEGAAIAHQVLGAIGFTREHTLHRFTRRLWAWRDDFGNESLWAVKLGRLVAAKGADGLWPMLAAR